MLVIEGEPGIGKTTLWAEGVGQARAEGRNVHASRSANGTTLSLCGIYVVKGTIFFFITDVAANHAVPNNAALQAKATTALSRL